MDASTLKLLVAILLFAAPATFFGEALSKREVAGRRLTRPQAQALGAAVGLVLGVGFLYATG